MSQPNVPVQIGREYVESDALEGEGTVRVRDAYAKIARINRHLYDKIPVEVVWTEDDPYDDYADMRERVRRTGTLRVFAGGTEPPFMSHEDNVKGRAVHDFFGHLEADVPFTFEGEYRKWQHVRGRYPRECAGVLFAEVVGQVAAAYYLDGGFDNPRFTQRACDAPARWLNAAADYVARQ